MESKVLFSVQEDELLVEVVAKHPSLYDLENPLYKDQIAKDNAWKEIAEILQRSVETCKKRWRNIKDTFNRRKKKGKSTGSAATSKLAKWPLADMLCFLDKVEHKRPSTSIGIGEVLDDSDQEEDLHVAYNSAPEVAPEKSLPNTSASEATNNPSLGNDIGTPSALKRGSLGNRRCPSNKRQNLDSNIVAIMKERSAERNEILKKMGENKTHSVDLFFESVAVSVKSLRPDLIHEAKMRTMQLVYELEQKNSSEPQPFSSSSSSQQMSRPESAHSVNTVCSSPPFDNTFVDFDVFPVQNNQNTYTNL